MPRAWLSRTSSRWRPGAALPDADHELFAENQAGNAFPHWQQDPYSTSLGAWSSEKTKEVSFEVD